MKTTTSHIFSGGTNEFREIEIILTTFQTPSFHPADTDNDGKIAIVEFVTFCGPVAAVFRRGINGGEYCYDNINLRAKDAQGACTEDELFIHPADTDDNGAIAIVEFVTFCGPIAAVFRQGNNGGEYCWDVESQILSPKITPECEF